MHSQEIRLSLQQRWTALQVLDQNRLSPLTEQLGVQFEARRQKRWVVPIMAALLTSVGASGCLEGTNCTPADTTHSCCVKNHLDAPSVCDGIEGAEGSVFRGASTTRGTTSTGKVETATVAEAAVAVGAAAVLSTEDDPARFKKLQAELDKLMEECAERAEHLVDSRRPKGEILDSARCNEEVGKDTDGKPITRAMELGNEKHTEALECVWEKLGGRIPGYFLIEQRYRFDEKTGRLDPIGKEEADRLVRTGRKKELKGTLKPDVVVHSGTPLQVRILYDFKFPCVKDIPATWRIYTRGPYRDSTQGDMYQKAFAVKPGRVTPGKKGVIR